MKTGDKLYCYKKEYITRYYTLDNCYTISYMNFNFLELQNDLGFFDRFSYCDDKYCFSKWFHTEQEMRKQKLIHLQKTTIEE